MADALLGHARGQWRASGRRVLGERHRRPSLFQRPGGPQASW